MDNESDIVAFVTFIWSKHRNYRTSTCLAIAYGPTIVLLQWCQHNYRNSKLQYLSSLTQNKYFNKTIVTQSYSTRAQYLVSINCKPDLDIMGSMFVIWSLTTVIRLDVSWLASVCKYYFSFGLLYATTLPLHAQCILLSSLSLPVD